MDMESLYVKETLAEPLFDHPPRAEADYEERAEWSAAYVSWFIDQTGGDGRMPADVRPTHRYEMEFNACLLDPEQYWRDTQSELTTRRRTLH